MGKPSKQRPTIVERPDGTFYSSDRVVVDDDMTVPTGRAQDIISGTKRGRAFESLMRLLTGRKD